MKPIAIGAAAVCALATFDADAHVTHAADTNPRPTLRTFATPERAWGRTAHNTHDQGAGHAHDHAAERAHAHDTHHDHAAGGDAPAAMTGGSARVGDLVIAGAWTRATPPGARVAAGYMTIENTGMTEDVLLAGEVAFADRVEVHEMVVADGMMRMSQIEGGLSIPPGAAVTLQPGGEHVMFVGLDGPLSAGDTVEVTLTFREAGEVTVSLPVAPIGATRFEGGRSDAAR